GAAKENSEIVNPKGGGRMGPCLPSAVGGFTRAGTCSQSRPPHERSPDRKGCLLFGPGSALAALPVAVEAVPGVVLRVAERAAGDDAIADGILLAADIAIADIVVIAVDDAGQNVAAED